MKEIPRSADIHGGWRYDGRDYRRGNYVVGHTRFIDRSTAWTVWLPTGQYLKTPTGRIRKFRSPETAVVMAERLERRGLK